MTASASLLQSRKQRQLCGAAQYGKLPLAMSVALCTDGKAKRESGKLAAAKEGDSESKTYFALQCASASQASASRVSKRAKKAAFAIAAV